MQLLQPSQFGSCHTHHYPIPIALERTSLSVSLFFFLQKEESTKEKVYKVLPFFLLPSPLLFLFFLFLNFFFFASIIFFFCLQCSSPKWAT